MLLGLYTPSSRDPTVSRKGEQGLLWVVSVRSLDDQSPEVVQEAFHPLFFLAPDAARAPHQFSEHHALRQSRVLNARHKSCEQDHRLDALPFRRDKCVQITNRVVGAIVLPPTDAASQEAVVGSAQRVVVAHAGCRIVLCLTAGLRALPCTGKNAIIFGNFLVAWID